jgi:peptide/nickel transport system permease protein
MLDERNRLTRPFVRQSNFQSVKSDRVDVRLAFPVRIFVHGDTYQILGIIQADVHLFGVESPGKIFLLGTDQFGRDVFSRLLFGIQTSAFISGLGLFLAMSFAVCFGGVSGYVGGTIDFFAMRITELFLAVPGFYGVLIIRNTFGAPADFGVLCACVAFLMAFFAWPVPARVMRNATLAIKEREFVAAARALGASEARIIFRHIAPNVAPVMFATAASNVTLFLFGESALSFLGFGVAEPEPSLGNLLTPAMNIVSITEFPWILSPGIALFLMILGWRLIAESLADAQM